MKEKFIKGVQALRESVGGVWETIIYTGSVFVRKVAVAITAFFLARYLTLEDFGFYSAYTSIALAALLITNFGFNEYLLVSSGGDKEKIRRNIWGYLVLSLVSFVLLCLSMTIWPSVNSLTLLLILAKTYIENRLSIILLTYFQAAKSFKTVGVLNIVYSIFVLLAVLYSYLFKLGLDEFLLLNVVGGVVFVAVHFVFVKPLASLSWSYFKSFWASLDKDLALFGFSSIAAYIFLQFPALVVSVFLPKTAAAIYFASYNIAMLPMLVNMAQNQMMLPKLIASETPRSSARILKFNILFIVMVSLLFLFVFSLWGHGLIHLIYGKAEYIQGYGILMIFLLANLFFGVGRCLMSFLMAKGFQKERLHIQLESFVLGIVLTAIAFHSLSLLYLSLVYLAQCSYYILRCFFTTRRLTRSIPAVS